MLKYTIASQINNVTHAKASVTCRSLSSQGAIIDSVPNGTNKKTLGKLWENAEEIVNYIPGETMLKIPYNSVRYGGCNGKITITQSNGKKTTVPLENRVTCILDGIVDSDDSPKMGDMGHIEHESTFKEPTQCYIYDIEGLTIPSLKPFKHRDIYCGNIEILAIKNPELFHKLVLAKPNRVNREKET